MTEIPEHLLKRSRERRAALGLPGGEAAEGSSDAGGGSSEDAAAPVPAAAAAAAPTAKVEAAPPPPPKPKPPHVQAALRRKRIPYWAMPVIALLPLWAYLYHDSVSEPPVSDEALTIGQEVYPGTCGSCHGPSGEGGTGAELNDGEVLKTFPDPLAMMQWIHLGADEWVGGSSGPYGDPEREGGPHDAGTLDAKMPAFGDLDAQELAAITRYVRENISGEAVASEEVQELYEQWAEEAIEMAEAGEIVYRDGVEPDPERIEAVSGGE